MRTALLSAALLTLTACTSAPPAPAPPTSTTTEAIQTPTTTTSAAPAVLTWGGTGTSSGVVITLAAPTRDGDTAVIPVTVDNKAAGKARLSFKGRVGQAEAAWLAGTDAGEFLPGENGTLEARFRLPAGATGDLVVETYANIDGAPTQNRLTFKGPLG
jgi:hypothetical protein